VELLQGQHRGIWGLLENMLAITWALPADTEATRIAHDSEAATAALTDQLRSFPDASATWHLQQGTIATGQSAAADWRRLLAEALLGYHDSQARIGG
jgi:hypothetical protein